MKSAITLLVVAVLYAQTPLEFGIVDDLIRGDPYISPLSIKLVSGHPSAGNTTLRMAVRAGVTFSDEGCFVFVDSIGENVNLLGRTDYRGIISNEEVFRLITVVRNRMRTHGSSGITHLEMDFVTPDDMGWLSVGTSLARGDSLLSGSLSPYDFWNGAHLRQVQVGMADFSLRSGVFDATQVPETVAYQVIQAPAGTGSHAWKSLVLPGWGQYSSGTGLPLINLLAEAGGIVLLLSDDYVKVGVGMLVLNHIISFTDLL